MKAIRIFAAAFAATLALSCGTKSNVAVDVEMPSAAEVDSVSYLIGVNFGSFLRATTSLRISVRSTWPR